ncbi:hypothetical protein K443DRAFT_682747 [Laccaria amethystina LaAM-08-1]|uniref:Uncharacterized protein n=1 Tax=Laccaria amethystina LaAM-08-1 TaxID=1095629 RepID=A0A0C9XDN2_9AGAR|nr:hypothetical protein K443DRAFT_682747 [Laccaria amethystina LaAM-08-1]
MDAAPKDSESHSFSADVRPSAQLVRQDLDTDTRGKTQNGWFQSTSPQPILFPPKNECLPGLIRGDLFLNRPDSDTSTCQVWVFSTLQAGVWQPISWGYEDSTGQRLIIREDGKLQFVSKSQWGTIDQSQMARVIYR